MSAMVTDTLSEIVSSTSFLGLAVILCMLYIWSRRPPGVPPSPITPLPVVGNLLSLQKDPRKQLAKWREKYGDIYSLYMGSRHVIVLNGFEVIKDALVKHADMFSDRPDLAVFTKVFQSKGIAATSGHVWKSQRTFAVKAMRSFGFGKSSFEGKVLEEIEKLVNLILSKNGEEEDYGPIYQVSSSNIMCSMVCGHGFEYDDPTFHLCCQALNSVVESLASTGLVNFMPFLQYLPGDFGGIKATLNRIKTLEETMINPEIERHYKEFDGTADDFISVYIKEIKDTESRGVEATVLRENFSSTVIDLYLGGIQPTATTLKWFVLFLLHHPDIQEKCFQEVQDNIGLGRLPRMEDKSSLPFFEATLAETQRLGNIVPLGVFRGVPDDFSLRGFHFPKGTVVLPNMDSVLMDPKVWPNPKDFQPERFLDKEGKFFKPEEFIPFSMGRRICIGEALTKMELFLMGTALVQRFEFQHPEDEPLPSLEPVFGGTLTTVPYKVKAVPRF